jgi:hypothetical protein
MAITTGSRIAITLNQVLASQEVMNVWTYSVLEIVGTPTAANYAEAWWNHVKAGYRGLASSSFGAVFTGVRVTELGNSTGEYGEWNIPSGEQTGTRTPPADPDAMPVFVSAGVRLSVGTRRTRPGQKRFGFLTQTDANSQTLGTAYQTALATLMGTMVNNMTLGAPAAGVVLVPNIVGLNADGTIRDSQLVTGYLINPTITSQVSRRVGRGI